MAQNYDDYYANISSEGIEVSSDENGANKKKIKVKVKKVEDTSGDNPPSEKKIVFKKKQEESSNEEKNSSWEHKIQEKSVSLNEALEKNKTPSKLKIVSRAPEKKQEFPEKKEKPQFSSQSSFEKKREESTNTERKGFQQKSVVSKPAEKFQKVTQDNAGEKIEKKGFQQNTKNIPQKNIKKPDIWKKASFDAAEGKKAKFFSQEKSQKHGKKFFQEEEESGFVRSHKIKHKKKEEKNIGDMIQNLTERTGETVKVPDILTLKEFSEKIGVPISKLIAEFMKNGMIMTINSQIDFDTMCLISETFEVKLERDISWGMTAAEIASGNIKDLLIEDDTSKLVSRPPVISIMGHVDHGKTSLLDYIRSASVASGEAGGITQSIWAYQVEYNEKKITFLDTPGHEAFTIMRSRGAKSTDIAILVVAADEGVKPQTIESISHAKQAGIPVIVAINKMDKEGANPDYVKSGLSEHGLIPEDWGWDTPMVPVSAHTGFGINELLEIILLVAEMLELKANPQRLAVATIIESHLDNQLGPVATALINTGNIEKGASVVCGDAFGKVKVLKDYKGQGLQKAFPGDPVLIVGLDKVVEGGDILQVVSWIDIARQKALEFAEYVTSQKKMKTSQLDILMSRIKSGNLKHLKIVAKADTNGSLEAVKNALLKLSTPETSVSIVHSGVGNITEGDVLMCGGTSAILIGFNVQVWANARGVLEDSGVEYIESKIIYHITERIEKMVSGMLDPKEVEVKLCEARVWGIFYSSKDFMILGLQIKKEGETIEKWALVRVFRGDKIIGRGKIENLKQGVEEVSKLEGPTECGIKFSGFQAVEEKDVLEVYKITIEK